jgi:hypothetical protein
MAIRFPIHQSSSLWLGLPFVTSRFYEYEDYSVDDNDDD